MKQTKILVGTLLFAFVALVFSACSQKDNEYDRALLVGKWQENTLFEVYAADGTGYTWDTKDDVTEEEAQPFTWTLEDGDQLVQIHITTMGANVPKTYTITNLDDNTLQYEDYTGKVHKFTKVKQ